MSSDPQAANISFALNECPATALRATSELQLSNGVKSSIVSYTQASSGVGTDTMSFVVNVPNNHILSGDVMLKIPARFTITNVSSIAGAGAGNENARCPLPDRLWGFSQCSFNHIINHMSVNVNSHVLQKRLSDIVPILTTFEDMSTDNVKLSDQYASPDVGQNFDDLFATNTPNALAIGGSPFALPGDTAYAKYAPRTHYKSLVQTIAAGVGAAGTATLEVEFHVSLPFSLFSYGGNGPGLSNVKKFGLDVVLNSQYSRMFSRPALLNNTISSISMSFTKAPELVSTFLLPSDFIVAGLKGPSGEWVPQTLAIADHVTYVTPGDGIIAGGGKGTVSSPALALSSTPKRIFIAAVRSRSEDKKDDSPVNMSRAEVMETPVCYGGLEEVKITFNGTNLAGYMQPFELYSMSARNGLTLPWNIAKRLGHPVCFDLTNGDIGVQDGMVGERVSSPLQITATVTNLDSAPHRYDLVVIVESEQFLTLFANGSSTQSTAISLSAAQREQLMQLGAEQVKTTAMTIGGSFLGTLFRWGRKVIPALVKHVPGFIQSVQSGSGFQPQTIGGYGYKPLGAGKKGGGVDSSTPATASKSRIL